MGMQAIPTGVFGPLPPQTVGLILGRSSTTMKGILVAPGAVDMDYTGEIKIMTHSPGGISVINKGQRIGQLLLIPYVKSGKRAGHKSRGNAGFGSSHTYWVQAIQHQRPELQLFINGHSFMGLLDTGADVSVSTADQWLSHWPKQQTVTQLQGIGQSQSPEQSSDILLWKDQEGHEGSFQPYVVAGLPVNLWGRDVMSQMGVYLYSPNQQVTKMMFDQGLLPKDGLGPSGQGRKEPIFPSPLPQRAGLGYF